MALFGVGKKLGTQSLIERAFRPDNVRRAIRADPEVTRRNPTERLIAAGDLNPLRERPARNVRCPRVKQSPEIVVPLVASELLLECTPFRVGLDNVAYAAEMDGPISELDVGIADTDRLGLWILRSKGPAEFALRHPFASAIAERPFRVGVADVLEKKQLVPACIGNEAAIRMFGKARISFPH